jgi:hypothetical protein
MKFQRAISIVPALPPIVNGVGDYAYILATAMEKKYAIESVFLSTNKLEGESNFQKQSVCLPERNTKVLMSVLNRQKPGLILLHYVGYAYNDHGLPFWLLRGLKTWKKENPGTRLVTIFHELYAQGKLWQKEFYTSPFQKKIAFDLHRLSDFSFVNTEITYGILKGVSPTVKTKFLPVFSNVGESKSLDLFSKRDSRLVIFGSPEVRTRLFKEQGILEDIVEKLKIEEVVEIGAERNSVMSLLGAAPIIQKGIMSKEKISELLGRSKFGILHYPPYLLTKSGIYAAYCAHGMVPIIVDRHAKIGTELKAGEHYLIGEMKEDLEKLSSNVLRWYQGHNVDQSSEIIYNSLMEL